MWPRARLSACKVALSQTPCTTASASTTAAETAGLPPFLIANIPADCNVREYFFFSFTFFSQLLDDCLLFLSFFLSFGASCFSFPRPRPFPACLLACLPPLLWRSSAVVAVFHTFNLLSFVQVPPCAAPVDFIHDLLFLSAVFWCGIYSASHSLGVSTCGIFSFFFYFFLISLLIS